MSLDAVLVEQNEGERDDLVRVRIDPGDR